MEQPIRDDPFRHRCLCVLTHADNERYRDVCHSMSADPDSPLCRDCVSAGHDDLPHRDYTEVLRERQAEVAARREEGS